MSAKGEKIVGKRPVFIGQSGGVSVVTVYRRLLPCDHSSSLFTTSFHQSSKCEQDVDLEDDQEEDGDDRDIFDMEADFNPTKDLEELERLLAKEPQSNFMEIHVHSVIINTKPFIHTQLMNPLYGVFKISKPCKVDKDIIFPRRFSLQGNVIRGLLDSFYVKNYSRQMQMVGGNGGNQFRQYAGKNIRNQNGYNTVQNNPNGNGNVVAAQAEGNAIGNNGNQIRCYNYKGLGHLARNCIVRPRRRGVAYLQTQLLIAQKEEAGIQLQAKEFDLMQASTSGTQTDKDPVYDSDGLAEVHNYDNCYNNEIFNMFTQKEQYTELLKPILETHQVQQNDSNVISKVSSVLQYGGTIDQHPTTVEETRAYFESLYNNLAIKVEKVNSVNLKMKETNADLTTKLARYKNQEKCFEIRHEKYDKLERCYQKSVYQEQCLTKKINALHLSSDKQITTLNEEISNLNKQLSKEKSTIYSLLEEKKKLKSDFKIREDELLDKQIQLENKIKELDNILGVDNTAKPRRVQPMSNTKNDMVPSASKSSCSKNKEVEVEEHPRNLLLSKNKKHMPSECNHVKLAIRNDKSEVVCAMCKQCLITADHDVCVLNYMNDMNSRGKKQKVNVSNTENQKKQKPKVMKPKKVGSNERLASPKPSKPRFCLRWSPTGRLFDLKGKIIAYSESESQSDCSNDDNACTSNPPEPTIKRFPNSTSFIGRRNTCLIRNLEEVDLLKGNHLKNLYTINLHEMASTSPICLMARATSTTSWLWHQCLSHLNFDIINDLNAKSSSPSTTPLIEKINNIENLIIDGKAILVHNEGKPLRKVDEDSEDEVASVDNDMANFLAKNDGYGTQSLLEQWKDSHELDDYKYDPYDDDLYEGQEIPETLQAFCVRLDIKVRGHKKK
ncbi:hypothetical protein Tco_0084159 [Tanacetum coccineum]